MLKPISRESSKVSPPTKISIIFGTSSSPKKSPTCVAFRKNCPMAAWLTPQLSRLPLQPLSRPMSTWSAALTQFIHSTLHTCNVRQNVIGLAIRLIVACLKPGANHVVTLLMTVQTAARSLIASTVVTTRIPRAVKLALSTSNKTKSSNWHSQSASPSRRLVDF